MSNYRIKLIASRSAIAFCVGATSPAWAQTATSTGAGSSQQSSSTSPSEPSTASTSRASSTTPDSSSDATTSPPHGTSQTKESTSSSATNPSGTTSGFSITRTDGDAEDSTERKASMELSQGQIRIATDEDEGRKVSDFKGQKVTGSDGREIGSIEDFVINKKTGKVAYLVVASGGFLGIGERLRLVAHDTLEPMAAAEGFTARIDEVAYEALPVIPRAELEDGRIPADVMARVDQPQSSTSTTETTAQPPRSGETKQGQEHALASQLAGIDVRSGTMEAGKIDDVIVDIQNGQASALFEATSEFAGTEGRFVVPLEKFEVESPKAEVIATTLSRTDLSALQPPDERLTPTGRMDTSLYSSPRTDSTTTTAEDATDPVSTPVRTSTSATTSAVTETGTPRSQPSESTPSSTELATTSTSRIASEHDSSSTSGGVRLAASSIRDALQNDTSLAKEKIQVSTREGKITLQGTVHSEEMKKKAEEVARRTSQSAQIDNQIRVKN